MGRGSQRRPLRHVIDNRPCTERRNLVASLELVTSGSLHGSPPRKFATVPVLRGRARVPIRFRLPRIRMYFYSKHTVGGCEGRKGRASVFCVEGARAEVSQTARAAASPEKSSSNFSLPPRLLQSHDDSAFRAKQKETKRRRRQLSSRLVKAEGDV